MKGLRPKMQSFSHATLFFKYSVLFQLALCTVENREIVIMSSMIFCLRGLYIQMAEQTDLQVLNREFKYYIFVGQRTVNLGKGFKLSFNVHKIFRIEEYFQSLCAINLISDALANNLSGVHDVLSLINFKIKFNQVICNR